MKRYFTAIFALSLLIVASCATLKKSSTSNLQNTLWELEYLSGSDQDLKTLFPVKHPSITLHESSKKAEGTDGCNGYISDFTVSENSISFGEPGPATLMYCGEGEGLFRKAMKKTNKYALDASGKLVFMTDDMPLMRFKKVN